jgi:hypothetical protein
MSVAAPVPVEPVLLRRADAAKLLCVSVALMNKMARLKTGPPVYKFSKIPLYDRQECLDFARASRQQ